MGLANFGKGLAQKPREIAGSVARQLPLVAWYGSTGNLAFRDVNVDDLQPSLKAITMTEWAIVTAERVDQGLIVLGEKALPPHARNERPTAGLAFQVSPSRPGELSGNARAVLHRIAPDMVAVWKLDLLLSGKLDRHHRRGGWGAVSVDIAHQVGGQWTSRSRRTIEGLIRRVATASETD